MNKVILIGHLCQDLTLRYTPSNMAVATFTIAVNRPKRQDRDQEADFVNIVVWGKQAENCSKYIKKGSKVAIEGRIQTRSYDGTDGKKKYVTEVVAENVQFLDTKKENAQQMQIGSSSEVKNEQNNENIVQKDPFQAMHDQVGMELPYVSDDLPF